MDLQTFEAENLAEQSHWWFTNRRWLFFREIERLNIGNDAHVLDVGTSTGTNLRVLNKSGFNNIVGVDCSDIAIAYCKEKQLGIVKKGDVCDLPFEDEYFQLVLATDIIEHIDDDGLALDEIYRVLAPGGYAIVTVPTFMVLWGLQDRVAQHKRRYLLATLTKLAQNSKFHIETAYYFNFLLFLPIWFARTVLNLIKPKSIKTETGINFPLLNSVLTLIFRIDVWSARYLKVPFGVSGMLVLKK